jgi:ABC-type phosphate transport system permease subunit
MINSSYVKKVVGAIVGALVAIPSIAGGFYLTYQLVTALGN